VEVQQMSENSPSNNLSTDILHFHQQNYAKPGLLQPIVNPKASYFQYSRYYGVLKEFEKLSFRNFIDVGCSEGMYLLAVKNKWTKTDLYGVDFSAIGLKKAKGSIYSSFLTCADAAHLPFSDGAFDLVLCSETLEHIVNDVGAFKELQRICRKTCVITVPSFNNELAKKLFKPDINCRKDSHLRKYSRDDLQKILEPRFRNVAITDISTWYPASVDAVVHMLVNKRVASMFSAFLSHFADIDYRFSKAGVHGHSFLCVCKK